MTYIITVRSANDKPRTYHAVGDLSAILHAAYEAGALGVTAMVQP